MTKRMLIDATQAEETRVAIVSGNRLEEYDYESAIRKQLKGSIFLAKVTRVEPSLQAAFVDYGGNRHGFLPFSEIHPDYYRIPIADREELLAEAAGEISEEPEEDLDDEDEDDIDEEDELDDDEDDEDEDDDSESGDEKKKGRKRGRRGRRRKNVDEVGGTKDPDEEEAPRPKLKHQYKIQEVVKRRQIMLIQVNKEERGNKGAAVTTYISLPGRYCVLMPNSPRGGGVSRKISSAKDRQRMKSILGELTIPQGMSVIMRTAGVTRSKAEIKRDLDYLMRLWDTIREETMQATAPALINEESNLCKRAIRDLYTRDIDEVLVAGDKGYKTAKSFMKMLMPSHTKRVQPYKDESIPLFMRYQVESQIDEIHKPTAQLRSGGYIVINPTEALVSIDVNSGRSTKERNIEGTALKTNMEAAEEVARQLRLRDLGGLVVIDFIDMEVRKNNTAVERKLKEAMSTDRARVQIGRISPFGLMELSRQRLNPSLVEAHFETCPTCDGIGVVRTVESAALAVLRAIEEEGIRERSSEVKIEVSTEVALYLLNQKRKVIQDIEKRHDLEVFIHANEDISSSDYEMDYVKDTGDSDNDDKSDSGQSDSGQSNSGKSNSGKSGSGKPESRQQDNDNRSSDDDDKSGGRRRRRGGRNRNRNRGQDDDSNAEDNRDNNNRGSDDNDDEQGGNNDGKKRRRRRGRRGGRRRRGAQADKSNEISEDGRQDSAQDDNKKPDGNNADTSGNKPEEQSDDKPKKSPAKSKKDESKGDKKADEKSEDKPKKSRAKSKKDEGKDDKKADEKSEDKPKKSRAKSKKDESKDDKKADEKSEDKPKKSRAKSKKDEGNKDEAKKEESNVAEFPEKEKGEDGDDKAKSADAEEKKKPAKKRKGWWNRLVD